MFLFPWSNFHELNLDWIIDKIKTLSENVDGLSKKVDETIKDLKQTVTSVINELIDDGQINIEYKTGLENKKILIMGDSISDTNYEDRYVSWVVPFTNLCSGIEGCEVTNSSVSGNGIQHVLTRIRTLDISRFDIIIFFVGTNDYGALKTPIGNSFAGESNTFNNYMMQLYNFVCENNPNAVVYYMSPLKRKLPETGAVAPLLAYYRTIYGHCSYFGWKFIDLYGKMELISFANTAMTNKYYEDGKLHISTAGGELLANHVFDYIKYKKADSIGHYIEIFNPPTSLIDSTNATPLSNQDNDNKIIFSSDGCITAIVHFKSKVVSSTNTNMVHLPDFMRSEEGISDNILGYGTGFKQLYLCNFRRLDYFLLTGTAAETEYHGIIKMFNPYTLDWVDGENK